MGRKKVLSVSLFSLLMIVSLAFLDIALPHGKPSSVEPEHRIQGHDGPYFVNKGNLPGITWADDVHTIFLRNKCGNCHTRGNEIIVDVLKEFALGVIDPEDTGNPYYSYHEMVYAEGLPQIQEGETLRDGQCCWPKDYPPHKQRRIWLGHAERSVIVRKLERDYYDWEKPPRFLEEGLGLLWGCPMPWYETGEHHQGAGNETEIHKLKVRSIFDRTLLHLSLLVGKGQDELHTLPPQIPVRDRDVLRYWINHAFQVMKDETGIEVKVFDTKKRPIKDAVVHFVGNFSHGTRQQVSDQIPLKTDQNGRALLSFPRHSVITDFWFVAAEKNGLRTEYQPITVRSGEMSKIELRLSQ
jgi:hypothetical protein